jgi:hypothetical protein
MPLFEFQVVQKNGSIESRYSDQPVSVGQELRIGSHRVIVVGQAARPESPLAASAFLCRRLQTRARVLSTGRSRPRWRRAA